MRFAAVLALAASCASGPEVGYRAAYANVWPADLVRIAVEATEMAGYEISRINPKPHWVGYITRPIRLEATDTADVAFAVFVVYNVRSRTKGEFTITVVPRAFDGDHELGDDRLPPSSHVRAVALSGAIRDHARSFEAPL